MIIGLTGRMASGKGTMAEMLMEEGFRYFSCSDAIRDELKRRGIEESRENLTVAGNDLRRAFGPGALAIRILEQMEAGMHYIVDSIRNPAEVEVLRNCDHEFILVCVEADAASRYERLVERGRTGDVASLEAFKAQESRELSSDDPNTQQLRATEVLADVVLANDGELPAFRAEVRAFLDTHVS